MAPALAPDIVASFLDGLRSALAASWIPWDGRLVTLSEYTAASPTGHEGDEQSVVDEISRMILGALGWTPGTFIYNRAEEDLSRPDFQVVVPGHPTLAPAFIVEDKSTATRDLTRVRRGSGGEQRSPLDQLRTYVHNTGSHGRVGLLCNGWVLEGWQFGAEGPVLLLRLDLPRLGSELCTAGPIHGTVVPGLTALWRRFSWAAFVEADKMADSIRPPPPDPAWIAQFQEAMCQGKDPTQLRDALRRWWEDSWRANARDASNQPELLVEAMGRVIAAFSADVRHQLDGAIERSASYDASARELEDTGPIDHLWSKVAGARGSFRVTDGEWAAFCTTPLRAWSEAPHAIEQGNLVEATIGGLSPHLHVRPQEQADQSAFSVGKEVGEGDRLARRALGKKELLERLKTDITAWADETFRRHLQRIELETHYRLARRANEAYDLWKRRVSASVLVGASEETLRDEFGRQTAYVHLVRLLLVRICEDKGLFQRKLSDGGLYEWEEQAARYLDYAAGRSYEYLTEMACECAQNVYSHFYGSSQVFDWYRMDAKMLLRALAALNELNLARIDTDIIGVVYSGYLEAGKHEQGRYYTAAPVVRSMLDLAGWKTGALRGRRIVDISCGSGSFLVVAARRLIDQYRGPDGSIPNESLRDVLREVKESVWGVDLNPFACYLAEMNLVIQVLDLVGQAQKAGMPLIIDRFHVYCDDSLLVNEPLGPSGDAALTIQSTEDLRIPELLKARAGSFRRGFDVVVGNPPYVRADEKMDTFAEYRERLAAQGWFTTAHKKWDLYVPFVQQNIRMLAEGPDARCCLITINSIETAPYAEKLRGWLLAQTTIRDVVFTEDLQLFHDAKWLDNVILCLQGGPPPPDHTVARWTSRQVDPERGLVLEAMDKPEQAGPGSGRILNRHPRADLDLSDTVPWEEVCYVSKGMVLHSAESFAEGEEVVVPAAYDPARFGEDLVADLGACGKRVRHRKFKRDALVSGVRDELHSRPYLDKRGVLRGGMGKALWLEYGPNGRCPALVDRPTFQELWEREKLVFGTFKGVGVDSGGPQGFALSSHSLSVAVLWWRLFGVKNRSLQKARAELGNRNDPDLSRDFSEWYLCALALSEPIQSWLIANRRSMKDHVYPDDISRIPVKKLLSAEQEPFIERARMLHDLRRQELDLAERGYERGPEGVRIPVWRLVEDFRKSWTGPAWINLLNAAGRGLYRVEPSFRSRDPLGVRADGAMLLQKRINVGEAGAALSNREAVARLFAELLSSLPAPLADRQGMDSVPADEPGLVALLAFLDQERGRLDLVQKRIETILSEIDALAWGLYRPKPDV